MMFNILGSGFPGGSVGKEPVYSPGDTGDVGLISAWGRSPGGRHGNPLKYSCLANLMDRGARQPAAHRVAKSGT